MLQFTIFLSHHCLYHLLKTSGEKLQIYTLFSWYGMESRHLLKRRDTSKVLGCADTARQFWWSLTSTECWMQDWWYHFSWCQSLHSGLDLFSIEDAVLIVKSPYLHTSKVIHLTFKEPSKFEKYDFPLQIQMKDCHLFLCLLSLLDITVVLICQVQISDFIVVPLISYEPF